jgi:hypothetical protein
MDFYAIKHCGGYFNNEGGVEYGWLMNPLGEAEHTLYISAEHAESKFNRVLQARKIKILNENSPIELLKVNVLPVTNEYFNAPYADGITYFVTGHMEGVYGPLEMYDMDASMENPEPAWGHIEGGFPQHASQFGTMQALKEFIEATDAYGTKVINPEFYMIKQSVVKLLK